jgi:chromate transport protein ChrA
MIVAGICIIVAAFFLWRRDLNTAFVIAALGLVAWFLNYRAQLKEIIAAADLEESSKLDSEEDWKDAKDD